MLDFFAGIFGGGAAAASVPIAVDDEHDMEDIFDEQTNESQSSVDRSSASEYTSESSEISLPGGEDEEREGPPAPIVEPISRGKRNTHTSTSSARRGYSYFDLYENDSKSKRTIASLLRGEDAEDELDQDPTIVRLKELKKAPGHGLPSAPSMVEANEFLEKFRKENYSHVALPHPPSLKY